MPSGCWKKSALDLHLKSKKAEAEGRMQKETSDQQQAREYLLAELMAKSWDDTKPREQTAAHLTLDAYKVVNMGFSGGMGSDEADKGKTAE